MVPNTVTRSFTNQSIAQKLRMLTFTSSAVTVIVAGVSTVCLLLADAHWALAALPAVVGLIAVIYSLMISPFIMRTIVRPFEGLTAAMGRVSDGFYDVAIQDTDRQDEIGEMWRSIEKAQKGARLIAELREKTQQQRTEHDAQLRALADNFEQRVAELVSGFAAASSQLESTATALVGNAENSTQQSTTVSDAMDSASAGVTAAAAATDEFALSINEISRQAAGSAEMAREAAVATRKADETIAALAVSAAEVGEIVELISSIAQRTNLLALNASIEAARGGEAGRGFAVVASEVKELAAQTAKATERVSIQIQKIQESTGTSVTSLQSIARQINDLEIASTSIAAAVDQQSAAGQDLARNIDLAARSTERMSSSLSQVREGSLATGAAAAQVLSSSSELKHQSAALRHQVDDFLSLVRKAA